MCATFSDEDIDKPVERADGRVIGTIGSVEGDRARVEPAPDAIDTIKARFGWAEIGDPFTLEADAVDAITETRVHLEEGFSRDGTTDTRPEPDRESESESSRDTADEPGSPQPDR